MPNASPVLAGLNSNVVFDEQLVNAAAQLFDVAVDFTDVDGNFTGGDLIVSGLLPEDSVGIRNEGLGAGQIAVTGSNIRFGNVIFASFTGGTDGTPLVVTFNASATSTAVDALIQNLTYANSSDTPTAKRNLVITIHDAAGAAAIPPISFSKVTGLANPFDGVDLGAESAITFADLDGDGDLDALTGAQDGTLRYFHNTGNALAPVFAEQVGSTNPFNGIDVGGSSKPSFADLDGDGDLDALIGQTGGILMYYRNTGTATAPVFTEQVGAANPFNGVDVGGYSVSTFADLDGDGDLDALVGEVDGVINYYRNTGTALAPLFTEQTGAANPFNGVDVGQFSNPWFTDLDGDGDLDALIGEFDGNIDAVPGQYDGLLNYYRNTGTALAPVFTEQTGAANPFNGINVGIYSAPSFADLDGDGDLDAVIGEFGGTLNYYRNTLATALSPSFTVQTGASNPFNGVDVGSYSSPAFADLDGDGDLDALIGESDGILNYYRNTGTGLAPIFTVQTGAANPFNGVNVGIYSAPRFADLDGDGDLDAIVGENAGNLNYFRNTGTALAPVFTLQSGAANPFNGVDVGSGSSPSFADLDGDGDLDALIGRNDGIVLYARNTGTALAPVFAVQPAVANPFNGINVGFFSSPSFADLDGDGDLDALIGEEDGVLNYYRNTGTALAPAFTLQTGGANPFNGVDIGLSSAPSFADFDGDGDLDAVVGDSDGTLNYYRNTGAGFVFTVNVTAQNESPFTGGNDVVNLNTLLASGNYFLADVTNALGGDDTVTLSNSVNVGIAVNGGAGNDMLVGGTGSDSIDGSGDLDTLIGGAGNDTLNGGAGTDTVSFSDRALAVALNPFINVAVIAGSEFDTILNFENFAGGGGNDTLQGTFGVNVISGGGGNDLIYAFDGGDLIDGGGGNDVVVAGIGNDTVTGGDGGDWLYGEDGNDNLSGTAKSGGAFDVLIGDVGDDTLEGSANGFDYFYGGVGVNGGTGDGNDSYIVRGNTGIKVMNDFEAGGTADVVRLLGTGLTSFAQVQAAMSFSGVINGTVLVVDGATQIWFLNGTQPANLTASDFLFV